MDRVLVESGGLDGDGCDIVLDGYCDMDVMKLRSRSSAILARCALRNPSHVFCVGAFVVAMAPRKYQKFGEEAKA